MEWEFTAEDVVRAKVRYMLADFRRDLGEEIRMNVGSSDGLQFQRTFNLIYDMCYALATGRILEEFLAPYAYDPPACEFLREIEPLMAANVEMLGAILQRMIMDGMEEGMALEQAVDEAALRHREFVAPVP
ncbi:hypothetical protein [Aromatoleum aromaticum]|uniref:Uncharacterized protein n=1 Tax=Aromatoleum aromaticum (strain DSM 19018 / LMG 30748 / EbN1) TaxID=76114 RepID=Q5NYR8_AROAE|nr:hypothetical protein [Aromatoleum aromaticum]NMG53323.1 hypothetical protein [Aromatoleum aromaticum]CAI09796.1 hypothetical protein ebA6416 [Aromatoleum aromaticum EbN1]